MFFAFFRQYILHVYDFIKQFILIIIENINIAVDNTCVQLIVNCPQWDKTFLNFILKIASLYFILIVIYCFYEVLCFSDDSSLKQFQVPYMPIPKQPYEQLIHKYMNRYLNLPGIFQFSWAYSKCPPNFCSQNSQILFSFSYNINSHLPITPDSCLSFLINWIQRFVKKLEQKCWVKERKCWKLKRAIVRSIREHGLAEIERRPK